jgi:hypothetical protein
MVARILGHTFDFVFCVQQGHVLRTYKKCFPGTDADLSETMLATLRIALNEIQARGHCQDGQTKERGSRIWA